MNKILNFVFLALLIPYTLSAQEGRVSYSMDFNWKFHPGEVENGEAPDLDDKDWRSLDVPHDWSIEGEFDQKAPAGGRGGYLPGGIAWYRKTFTLPSSGSGKTAWIDFDGVYMNSDVWINGHHLGHRPFGYIGFHYDITPYLKDGTNTLAVRVDNSLQPNSRWYPGSGIYRHVWLTFTGAAHIGHWGTYVTTPEITKESALVNIRTRIENKEYGPESLILRSLIMDANGDEVGSTEAAISMDRDESTEIMQEITVDNPILWSVESPGLYTLRSELRSGTSVLDRVQTVFGIRHIEYSAERGFLLNGEQVKMKGVCLHHDGGCVGAAVPIKVWERRLEILKEMGCNAIRTAHNPMAPEFMDLCDRMGFLVMNEIFDEWKGGKVEHGYHNYFDEWSQKDLIDFIHRDRNHPSVIMWSAGNEIGEQSIEGGHEVLRLLIETFHREDPTRPVTTGNDHIAADGRSAKLPFLEMLDIVGYNYVDRWHERRELYYSLDRQAHPDWKMVGTESASNGGIRGLYRLGPDTSKVMAAYNSRMIRAEQLWKFEAMNEYIIGDFMWTGIDYLGEARWPSKNASSGVIDMCGFPKDGFYFYQSQWTEDPMVHIFPHWNWAGREGQVFPVLVYTNCDTVELFLNGKSYGAKSYEFPRQGNSERWNRYAEPYLRTTTADLHLSWDIPYEPGVLKAVGKKGGKEVMIGEVRTTGAPHALRLSADRVSIGADARDVAHVKIEIVDSEGNIVPTADNRIHFSLEGEATLIGVDNGNPLDHDPFKLNERNAFNGLALAILQSTRNPGKITLKATSEDLQEATIILRTEKITIKPFIK